MFGIKCDQIWECVPWFEIVKSSSYSKLHTGLAPVEWRAGDMWAGLQSPAEFTDASWRARGQSSACQSSQQQLALFIWGGRVQSWQIYATFVLICMSEGAALRRCKDDPVESRRSSEPVCSQHRSPARPPHKQKPRQLQSLSPACSCRSQTLDFHILPRFT